MDNNMPVIVYASSKGGAGKTTSCILSACEVARQGLSLGIGVSLIDADPNQHSAKWATRAQVSNIDIFTDVTEDSIIDVIDRAKNKNAFSI